MSRRGVVRAIDAVAVSLAGADARQVTVPDESVDLGESDPFLCLVPGAPARAEQAELDLVRCFAVQREIGAHAVVAGAERVRGARPDRPARHNSAGCPQSGRPKRDKLVKT